MNDTWTNTTQLSCGVEWPGTMCGQGTCVNGQCICDSSWSYQSDYFNSRDCYEYKPAMQVLYYIDIVVKVVLFFITTRRMYIWWRYEWNPANRSKKHQHNNQNNNNNNIQQRQSTKLQTIQVHPQHEVKVMNTDSDSTTPRSISSSFMLRLLFMTFTWSLLSLLFDILHLFTTRRILFDPVMSILYGMINILGHLLFIFALNRWAEQSQVIVYQISEGELVHHIIPQHPLQGVQHSIIWIVILMECGVMMISIMTPWMVDQDSDLLRRQLTAGIYVLSLISSVSNLLFIVVYCYETIRWLEYDSTIIQSQHTPSSQPRDIWQQSWDGNDEQHISMQSSVFTFQIHSQYIHQGATIARSTRLLMAQQTLRGLRIVMFITVQCVINALVVCVFVGYWNFFQSKAGYAFPFAMIVAGMALIVVVGAGDYHGDKHYEFAPSIRIECSSSDMKSLQHRYDDDDDDDDDFSPGHSFLD